MGDFEGDVSAAGVFLAAVAGLLVALFALTPPTPDQLAASDPLVQLAAATTGLWSIPVISLLPALVWWRLCPVRRPALTRAGWRIAAALGLVAIFLPALRLVSGPSLPSFVPPEESARPGLALGLGAALIEEGLFRLGLLAGLYVLTRRFFRSDVTAAAAAIAVTALVLAAAHEIGPGAGAFEWQYCATRVLVLGGAMGVLFFRPGPSFLVALHSAAHVGIALLFPGVRA